LLIAELLITAFLSLSR